MKDIYLLIKDFCLNHKGSFSFYNINIDKDTEFVKDYAQDESYRKIYSQLCKHSPGIYYSEKPIKLLGSNHYVRVKLSQYPSQCGAIIMHEMGSLYYNNEDDDPNQECHNNIVDNVLETVISLSRMLGYTVIYCTVTDIETLDFLKANKFEIIDEFINIRTSKTIYNLKFTI